MEIGYIVCVLDFYKILFDLHLFTFLFNGENLRGYAGVRATKRSILISHFTIYLISNIFFLPFYLNIIFLIFLYFSSISLSFSSSLSLSYLKVCLIGIILKILCLSLI